MEPSTDGEDSTSCSVKDATTGGGGVTFPLASLRHRRRGEEKEAGAFEFEGMDVEDSQSQNSQNYASQHSSTPPELKRSRHDPVYRYENSYDLHSTAAREPVTTNGTKPSRGGQQQPRPSKKRDRSQDSLTNSFDKVVMVSSPRTDGSNANYKRFRSGAGYGESPSPTTTTASLGWKTPDTSTKDGDKEEDAPVDDIDYSKVNNVLRNLRLSRQGRKSQQQRSSRSPSKSGGGMSISTIGASPDVPAAMVHGPSPTSAPVNLLDFQQRHVRDYQRRIRTENGGSGSQSSSDMEL